MLVWLMIIVGIVFLDQLTKWLTVINLDLGESFTVIEGFFNFTYVRNTGAAFSMFNEPDQRWIFMSISTVSIIALSVYLWFNRKSPKLMCIGLAFILGGGIGNMIDRTMLGYVIDFLDFIIFKTSAGVPVHFATFNIADSFVCVGVGLFALHIVLEEIANAKKEKEKKLLALETEASLTEQENAENVD